MGDACQQLSRALAGAWSGLHPTSPRTTLPSTQQHFSWRPALQPHQLLSSSPDFRAVFSSFLQRNLLPLSPLLQFTVSSDSTIFPETRLGTRWSKKRI